MTALSVSYHPAAMRLVTADDGHIASEADASVRGEDGTFSKPVYTKPDVTDGDED